MRKRAIFINVAPSVSDDNGRTRTQSGHQTPSFVRHRNDLNISPGEVGREAFTKTPWKKVRKIRENERRKKKELCHYIRIMQITNNILLQNIIFDCLKPIYNFLRALGVFPLSRRSSTGEFQFNVQSPAMIYSFLIFVALIVNMHLWFYSSLFPFPFLPFYPPHLLTFHLTSHSKMSKLYNFSDLLELHIDRENKFCSKSRGPVRGSSNCISLHCQSLANHYRPVDVV